MKNKRRASFCELVSGSFVFYHWMRFESSAGSMCHLRRPRLENGHINYNI